MDSGAFGRAEGNLFLSLPSANPSARQARLGNALARSVSRLAALVIREGQDLVAPVAFLKDDEARIFTSAAKADLFCCLTADLKVCSCECHQHGVKQRPPSKIGWSGRLSSSLIGFMSAGYYIDSSALGP